MSLVWNFVRKSVLNTKLSQNIKFHSLATIERYHKGLDSKKIKSVD